jgi:hypothetical protein
MPVNPTLNQVRSYKNYGLLFQGSTYDPIFTKGWLESSPNVSIQGNSCYIDYSQSFDTSDRTYLKRTFNTFSVGTTFYVQNTEYYDPITNTRLTLGGTCNYGYSLNDGKIIVGNIASGLTLSSNYNFYKKENFISPIQYTFQTSGATTTNNYVLSTFPRTGYTTFKEMGILGSELGYEEYVEISGATSINYGRLLVDGLCTLKDNQEVLYFVQGVTSQSLLNKSSDVKMYIRGKSSVTEIQQPENITGIYRIHDADNKLIDCYENQNYYQVFLRNQGLTQGYNGYWVECDSCPDNIYGSNLSTDGVPSNLVYDNNVYLYISQLTTNAALTLTPSLNYAVFTQRTFTGTPQSASRLTFSINTGLKIDLSHASLQGWQFDVFTDFAYTIPLLNNIYISGEPGYDQSYVLITSTNSTPRTLYCRFTGLQTINMVFNI